MRVLTRWKAVLGGLLVLLSLCALRAGAPLSAAAETAAPAETVSAPEEPEQLPLTVGAMSRDVRKAKERLQSLRYFRAKQLNAHYTEEVAEAVRLFQRINGLPETGEVDRATWDLLFSGAAEKNPYPTMPPLQTPAPTPVPDWPDRDPEGYLIGDGEYFYENDEAGLWIYLGADLQVTIVRRRDSSIPLEWFETDILMRDGERLRTVSTDPAHPGRKFQYPYVIAKNEGFVLGFSDDFYGDRIHDKTTVGVIIREGGILREKTFKRRSTHLPNLDMMAQFPDGTLKVYECTETTAKKLLAAGAINVFSFGPILIRDGQIDNAIYDHYRSLEPRQALGMITPNHYFLLSVQGRNDDSKGAPLQRVAEIMKEHGVVEALNLDGGNTMALVFRGRMLNKLAVYKKKKFVRTVTSLIGIGHTVIPDE